MIQHPNSCIAPVLLALGVVASASAFAAQPPAASPVQERGFYVGAGVGQSRADGCDRLYAVGFAGDCDNKDTAWNVHAGYQITPHFAAELAYGAGELNVNGRLGGVPYTASVESDILEATGLAMLPIPQLPQLSLYARAGFFYWDTDAQGNFGGAVSTGHDSGGDVTYGLGAQWSFTRNWSARAEWQRYRNIGSASALGKADADVVRATVQFRF